MQSKFSGLLICLFFILMSCDSKQVYDDYQSVDTKWHKDSIKEFKIVPDTLTPYNLFVNIRNTNDYKYNNIFLIVSMNYPNGKVSKDTLEYKMAAPNGELLGKGFSDIKENKLWYKGLDQPFVFNESGEYSVTIQHAMRQNGNVLGDQFLEGITDVGLRIESVNNK